MLILRLEVNWGGRLQLIFDLCSKAFDCSRHNQREWDPYRRIEEKTGRFGPASMEVAILSIFTGSDEEPAAIERYNRQLPPM